MFKHFLSSKLRLGRNLSPPLLVPSARPAPLLSFPRGPPCVLGPDSRSLGPNRRHHRSVRTDRPTRRASLPLTSRPHPSAPSSSTATRFLRPDAPTLNP